MKLAFCFHRLDSHTARHPGTDHKQCSLLTGCINYFCISVTKHSDVGNLENLFGTTIPEGQESITIMIGSRPVGKHGSRAAAESSHPNIQKEEGQGWCLQQAQTPNPSQTVTSTGDQVFRHTIPLGSHPQGHTVFK